MPSDPDLTLSRLHAYCTDLESILSRQEVDLAECRDQLSRVIRRAAEDRAEADTLKGAVKALTAGLCGDCLRKAERVVELT